MKNQANGKEEQAKLQERIAQLEEIEKKHKEAEDNLKSANQQLEASNQQLRASEQQLKVFNEQLQISEQRLNQQKQAAEENREFAENIINTVRQPLLVLNQELRVVSANHYFYRTFRVSENETQGTLLHELGNKQWDIPKLKKLLKQTLPEQTTVDDFEVEHNFETIGHKIMLLNARELSRKERKERLILLAVEDVTQRREYEKELIWLNNELEKKAEELQQILYITTHDLRSPLVNIQGFTREMEASLNDLKSLHEKAGFNATDQRSLKTIMEDEIPEAIHYITTSIVKMDNLLKGLLALSRLGRQKLSFRKLAMNSLVQEVLDDFQFEIDKSGAEVSLGDLPDCVGDDLQVNQMFSNLIGNSLKFLDAERPGKIDISGKEIKDGCTYIVEDNGIGISPEYQEKVFGLFEKLDPGKQGIGLGMNVVKQAVEKHHGNIELESELGKGTKFTIFIPERKTN